MKDAEKELIKEHEAEAQRLFEKARDSVHIQFPISEVPNTDKGLRFIISELALCNMALRIQSEEIVRLMKQVQEMREIIVRRQGE